MIFQNRFNTIILIKHLEKQLSFIGNKKIIIDGLAPLKGGVLISLFEFLVLTVNTLSSLT